MNRPFVVMVLGLLGVGCTIHTQGGWFEYTSPQPVVVQEAPPPVRVEVQSAPGYDDAVWIAGHWEWRLSRYIWVSGRWERARHGYAWVAPRYAREGASWLYVRGHWRPAGATARTAVPPARGMRPVYRSVRPRRY